MISPRHCKLLAILASLVLGAVEFSHGSDKVTAPSSAEIAAPVPAAAGLARELEEMAREHEAGFIDAGKTYSLPELVNLAQRHNRTTRAAWEEAVQAAASTGLSASQFYPLLSLVSSYGGGYWYQNLTGKVSGQTGEVLGAVLGAPMPVLLNSNIGGGYSVLAASVNLRWMLFDFGQRIFLHNAARRQQLAANLTFNATHQTVTFQVTEAYYVMETDRRLIEAEVISDDSAAEVLAAVQARYGQGLVTEPDLLQARQAKAQADFDLLNARSNAEIARINLIEAVGGDPGCTLRVAPADFATLGSQLKEPLDRFVQDALRRKPDLLAKVAETQAALASLKAAKAGALPKISLNGIAGYSQFNTGIQGGGPFTNFGIGLQTYGAFVNFEWPVFNGGADYERIKSADAGWREATETMLLARDQAVADVWRAYVSAKAAIARRKSADELGLASRASYESLKESYGLGRVSIQDVLSARASYAQSEAVKAQCDGAIAASLVTLTYNSGSL